jgi:tetratricopeptide (TPR) repeat protein
MPQARPLARRLSGFVLSAVAALCLSAATAAAAGLEAQAASLRARNDALVRAERWDPAAEAELLRDLDAALTQLRGHGGGAGSAAALRELTGSLHARHREALQRLEAGGEPEESEEYVERRPMALQSLYLRNWIYLDAATRFESRNPRREEWLRDAMTGFGDLTTTGDAQIAAESFYGRALAERALGRTAEADADLRRALEKKPPPELAARIGAALVEGQIDAEQLGPALESSAALLRQAPGPEAEFLRAKVALLALGSLPLDAERTRALRAEAAALVVALERRGGRWPDMARQLVAAGITKPEDWLSEGDSATIRWAVAEALRTSGRCREALPLYEALTKQRGGADALVATAECQYREGDYVAALATLARVPAGKGGSRADAAYLRFKAAEALDQRENTAASRARLRETAAALVADHPAHVQVFEAHFRLGELTLRDGDRVAAAQHFDRVQGDPQFALQAGYQAAQAYVAEWEARAEDGAEPDPTLAAAALERLRRFLADAEAYRGRPGARPADRATLAPLEARARVLTALILTRSGNRTGAEEAIVLLEDFPARNPEAADLHGQAQALRAVALLELERPADAGAAVTAFLATPQLGSRDYALMQRLGVRVLELAAERTEAGDAAGAQALNRTALALYEALLAAVDKGAVKDQSPAGLRNLIARLRKETAATPVRNRADDTRAGGAAWIVRPPTMVSSTRMSRIAAGLARGSPDRTTRSASVPGSVESRSLSWRIYQAASIVIARSAPTGVSRCSAPMT